jgi:hypothetical protein
MGDRFCSACWKDTHTAAEIMAIPTEPIGSIPRPPWLIEAAGELAAGHITARAYGELAEQAVRETAVHWRRCRSGVSASAMAMAATKAVGMPNSRWRSRAPRR